MIYLTHIVSNTQKNETKPTTTNVKWKAEEMKTTNSKQNNTEITIIKCTNRLNITY